MSNFRQDFPQPRGNGWGEYQRLVLAELERHNSLINSLNDKLADITIQLVLLKEDNGKIKSIDARLRTVENADLADAAITRYRKWLIGILIVLVGSVAFPIIKAIFFPGT